MLLFSILTTSILPMFIMIAFGFILDKKFNLDLHTLSKLNFYILLPSFVFKSLYLADFHPASIGIVLCGLAILFAQGLLAKIYAQLFHYDLGKTEALKNIAMFNNGGNIGIAIITLIFSNPPYLLHNQTPYLHAALITALALFIIQNISCNTIGFYQAGRGKITTRDALSLIFHMPTIYVVPSALLSKLLPIDLTTLFLWPSLNFFAHAFVGLAMITLGVQIARTPFNIYKKDVLIATAIRLIIGPILAIIVIYLYAVVYQPLDPIAAQTIVIIYSVPTAINVALIAAEMRNYAEYSTQVVMATTLISTITMPPIILLVMHLFPIP